LASPQAASVYSTRGQYVCIYDPKDNKVAIYPCAWTRIKMLSKWLADKHGKTQASYRIDAHVGSHLRMRRIEMGMTQEKLAEAFGLTSNGG
jgi:hypothetical protein